MADVPDGVRKGRIGRRCRRFEAAYCERRANSDAGCQARTPPQEVGSDHFRSRCAYARGRVIRVLPKRRDAGQASAHLSEPHAFLGLSTCSTMSNMQRILIAIGAVLLLVGLLWPWLSRLGLGRLPGDIRIDTEHGIFYLPITTCVVISVVLSIVIWLIRR